MKAITVKRIPRARKYKFGVYVGDVCITSHKTEEEANYEATHSRKFYEYWGGSVSVQVDNSTKRYVKI